MQGSRGVSWFTVLCALCTLQCAELKPFGDSCGNGAVDPRDEDCDGESFSVEATSSRGKPKCGAQGTANACHFVCGPSAPAGSQCPNEDWACRQGVCVELEPGDSDPEADEKRNGLASPVEVVGPAAAAHVADFDGDGADEIVAIPVNRDTPLVIHFSPLDITTSKAHTLFSSPDSRVVLGRDGQPMRPARLMAVLEDGIQVTVVRASLGLNEQRVREIESEFFAIGEMAGARVDFLFQPRNSQDILVWVHGANGAQDELRTFDLTTGAATTVMPTSALYADGTPLAEHRIVVGLPAKDDATCGRIAVFTRDSGDRLKGVLEILTPKNGITCAWTGLQKQTVEGVYPVARGPHGAFASDLDHDGIDDLIVNARVAGPGNTVNASSYVLRDMEGQFERVFPSPGAAMVIGAGSVSGHEEPALLICDQLAGGLCKSTPSGPPTLSLRFRTKKGEYSRGPALRQGEVPFAGFADVNGDGQQDVWAWFTNETGPRLFESTPDGFLRPVLVDHSAGMLRSIVAAALTSGGPRDLLAVTENGTTPSAKSDAMNSKVLFTSGRSDLAAMASKVVTRFVGRSSPTVVSVDAVFPEQGTRESVLLTTCVAGRCDDDTAARDGATFTVARVRELSGDWLGVPTSLPCPSLDTWRGNAGALIPDEYRTAMRIGALQASSGAEPETQLITVQSPRRNYTLAGKQGARWARLKERAPHPPTCDPFVDPPNTTAWIAVAPLCSNQDTCLAKDWIALATDNYDDPTRAVGRAYLLSEGRTPIPMTFENDDSYQAISALPADLDNDGDTDFAVLAREGGIAGRDLTASDRRVRIYMNVACEGRPEERCLFVNHINLFEGVSGDALAWAQSPIEAVHFATSREKGIARVWWLGAVTGGTQSGTGMIKTGRFRVDRVDRDIRVVAVAGSASEAPVPATQVKYQHVAWGDFDGDTALDLLYVSDRGSRIYKRAEKAK